MMTSDTMTEEDRCILRDRIARSLSEILSDKTGYKVTLRFVHNSGRVGAATAALGHPTVRRGSRGRRRRSPRGR